MKLKVTLSTLICLLVPHSFLIAKPMDIEGNSESVDVSDLNLSNPGASDNKIEGFELDAKKEAVSLLDNPQRLTEFLEQMDKIEEIAKELEQK